MVVTMSKVILLGIGYKLIFFSYFLQKLVKVKYMVKILRVLENFGTP